MPVADFPFERDGRLRVRWAVEHRPTLKLRERPVPSGLRDRRWYQEKWKGRPALRDEKVPRRGGAAPVAEKTKIDADGERRIRWRDRDLQNASPPSRPD